MHKQKTKKTSPLNYIFAVGRIRALERFLIKEEVFNQAIDADLKEALRLFVESDLYSEKLLYIKNSLQLEDILREELLRLKKTISDLLLDQELKTSLDVTSLTTLREIALNYRSPFLIDYVFFLIDMHNIKTFLRLHFLGEPEAEFSAALATEGFIPKKTFLRLYPGDLAHFLNRLEYVHTHREIIDYSSFLKETVHRLEKERSFISLEKAINDFLIQFLKSAKYMAAGPEPLLAYYFAKKNEMDLMRMIILAKLNNIAADLVKERLNLVYA